MKQYDQNTFCFPACCDSLKDPAYFWRSRWCMCFFRIHTGITASKLSHYFMHFWNRVKIGQPLQPCAQFEESVHFPLINTLLTVSLITAVWAFGFWHLVMKLVKQCLWYTASSATKSCESNRPETWKDRSSSLWPHASRILLSNSGVHTTLLSFAVWYLV